jgi:hypothetical protein
VHHVQVLQLLQRGEVARDEGAEARNPSLTVALIAAHHQRAHAREAARQVHRCQHLGAVDAGLAQHQRRGPGAQAPTAGAAGAARHVAILPVEQVQHEALRVGVGAEQAGSFDASLSSSR